LLLCDTRAAGDTPEVAKGRRMMAADVIADGSELAADAMLPKLLSPHTRSSQPDLEIRVRELIVATTPMGIAATQRGMAEREDMTPRLAEIDVPTLVICGADDVITPPDEMQRMTAAMTHATYVEIPQAGHLAPWERPDVVNSTMARFLDR
jgi:pimeloyl-ACP methyl ester carboxylesterase